MDEAMQMARLIAAKNPMAVRLAKLAVREGARADLGSALLIETLCQSVVFGTQDHLEGLNAFLEKREPNYTGQ